MPWWNNFISREILRWVMCIHMIVYRFVMLKNRYTKLCFIDTFICKKRIIMFTNRSVLWWLFVYLEYCYANNLGRTWFDCFSVFGVCWNSRLKLGAYEYLLFQIWIYYKTEKYLQALFAVFAILFLNRSCDCSDYANLVDRVRLSYKIRFISVLHVHSKNVKRTDQLSPPLYIHTFLIWLICIHTESCFAWHVCVQRELLCKHVSICEEIS